jgi:hypothetical protein
VTHPVSVDVNGCFGEALDTAFRLLDAAHLKQALRAALAPLALVVSAGLGESGRLISVEVGGHQHQGLIQTLGRTA